MKLNEQELELIYALRSTADRIETGAWVLERNTNKHLFIDVNTGGVIQKFTIIMDIAHFREK
jgi:hypothetical protein